MQYIGHKVIWPNKSDKTLVWKDKSKWCVHHEDFGHLTEYCFTHMMEISYLFEQRKFEWTIGKKERQDHAKDPRSWSLPQKVESPPSDAKVIKFISGGLDICGTSCFSAKMHAKISKMEKEYRPRKNAFLTKETSFNKDDMENMLDPHHDGPFITLYVSKHFVQRILIDGGDSVNIILLILSWACPASMTWRLSPWLTTNVWRCLHHGECSRSTMNKKKLRISIPLRWKTQPFLGSHNN